MDDGDLLALVPVGCGSRGSSRTPPPSPSTNYGGAKNYFGKASPRPCQTLEQREEEMEVEQGEKEERSMPSLL
jgi:hypothetical protein